MMLYDLFEGMDDDDHQEALSQTGFWGSQAAGCLIYCSKTKRFLINHRSQHVQEPGTWGTVGGAIDSSENPKEAARREMAEETGYSGNITLRPLYVFKKGTFRYSNFLAIVDEEFTPYVPREHAWETEGWEWCEWSEWPRPMHFGLKALLSDKASAATIMQTMREAGPTDLTESKLHRYRYACNCVSGPHGRAGDGRAIHEMTDIASDITYEQFVRAVDINDLRNIFGMYNWSRRDTGQLRMRDDYAVSFHRSRWRGIPCIYVDHSRIEYIFTIDGKRPKYDPEYDDVR
jgi:8-oxo-dGTP pyrophosphatase MutT (NUDIX family)